MTATGTAAREAQITAQTTFYRDEAATMTTPVLVREYASCRVAASAGRISPSHHRWLGAVVDELRSRGVLD